MRDMLPNVRSEYQAVSQVGSERQLVRQKTNDKLDDIIYAQEEIQVRRAAHVEYASFGGQGIARCVVLCSV